jgi:sugar lactone lactonase YvrE
VDAATGIITTVAGNGLRGHYADGIPAVLAFLNQPYDVAVDADGGFFVSELANQRIRYVAPPDGPLPPAISTVAGTGTAGYSGDGGPASAAQVNNPTGIALDDDGNLLFADTTNARIRRITIEDGIIETLAGNGVHEFAGDGGPGPEASMWIPNSVALHPLGLLVADTGNHRIRLLELV